MIVKFLLILVNFISNTVTLSSRRLLIRLLTTQLKEGKTLRILQTETSSRFHRRLPTRPSLCQVYP